MKFISVHKRMVSGFTPSLSLPKYLPVLAQIISSHPKGEKPDKTIVVAQ
ncbi:MAG: hypothetical protein ABIK39_03390 [candidate division WOR-3 bacterium]